MMGSSRPHLDWSKLPALFPRFARPRRWLPLLRRHSALVADWNSRAGLSAVAEDQIVRRNYAESMEIWSAVLAEVHPDGGALLTVADVGPGAGYPGMVGAILSPRVGVHLIEAHGRRADFLALCRRELGAGNAFVRRVRAEDVARGTLRDSCDAVVARAVAPLATLLEYSAPLLRVGGLAIHPKGRSVISEVHAARAAADRLGLEFRGLRSLRVEVSATPFVACYLKVVDTPEGFPRRPGVARKRPLT